MTWATGAWSPTAWATGAWPGTVVDGDIPVNVAAAFLAALTAVGQPSQTAQVSGPVQAEAQVTPSMSLTAPVAAQTSASKSILGTLYTGWPVVSASYSSSDLSPRLGTGLQVSPTVQAVATLVGTPVLSLRASALSTCSLVLADGPGIARAFSAASAGGSTFTVSVYTGWPVAGATAASSSVSGVAGLSVSPTALAVATLTTSMEWKLDQGLAAASVAQGSFTLAPTVYRGLAAQTTTTSEFTSQVGIAYAAVGQSFALSSASGQLGLGLQAVGQMQAGLNQYGTLNQSMHLRGSLASLLATYWATLPWVAPTEHVVLGDARWNVLVGGGEIAFTSKARVLSAVSLRLHSYSLAATPRLSCTQEPRSWAFDPDNSEYTYEGISHESYGTQGPGRGQDTELRLQPGDRNF